MKNFKSLREEAPLVRMQGVFRRQVSLFGGVALILGATIGAGILGIPYAVSKVGIGLGLVYIVVLGLLMMGLNLLVGEVAVRTKQDLQLVGFATKYLGSWGGLLMSGLVYIIAFAILVIYIIGEGETLSVLFGGPPLVWSIVFWYLGSVLILIGMRTIKTVEMLMTLGILLVVVLIALVSAPHLQATHFRFSNLASLLLPYGVILFAFSGANAIPEAHSILKNKDATFKRAIIISGIISIVVYTIFTVIVVGVTGGATTEIATIGLGEKAGRSIFILGNFFAVLAMGTSFIMGGLSLRDSLRWDFKLSYNVSTALTCGVPLVIFLLGVRSFIAAIDLVGGVFVSLQLLLLILIYWKAKQKGDLKLGRYHLHHTVLLAALLVLALTLGAVYSVVKLF